MFHTPTTVVSEQSTRGYVRTGSLDHPVGNGMEPTTRSLNLPQRARLLPAGSGRINSLFVLSVLDLHWLATMGFSGPLASPALHHHGTAEPIPDQAAAHSPWFPQQPRRLFFPTANTERNVAESAAHVRPVTQQENPEAGHSGGARPQGPQPSNANHGSPLGHRGQRRETHPVGDVLVIDPPIASL